MSVLGNRFFANYKREREAEREREREIEREVEAVKYFLLRKPGSEMWPVRGRFILQRAVW
jgi:hypothetical protein